MKIAVDAMGGDHAPQAIVEGVEAARDEYKDIDFVLYGDENKVKPLIKNDERISFVQSHDDISMGEEPVKAIRHKRESSIVLAATAVRKGQADAFFSAGNTGAVLAAGLLLVGRIKGIDRPGLTSILPITKPGAKRNSFVYLDSGANAESKERNLIQYAYLGRFYAETVLGIDHPRIALLNNGAEADKGDKLHKEVHAELAKRDDLNFIGNIESGDLLYGKADVVVSDGWTANAALKATEGTAKMVMSVIRDAIVNGGFRAKLGYLLLRPAFHKIGKKMSTSTYGGAVLLGLKAPVVKTHGASDATAVKNTISQIHTMINSKVIDQTVEFFSPKKDVDKSSSK